MCTTEPRDAQLTAASELDTLGNEKLSRTIFSKLFLRKKLSFEEEIANYGLLKRLQN